MRLGGNGARRDPSAPASSSDQPNLAPSSPRPRQDLPLFPFLEEPSAEPAPAAAPEPARTPADELDISITTVPEIGDGRKAYVGGQVQFGLLLAHPPRDRAVRARTWGLDLPGEGSWRQVPAGPTTTLPITKAGAHRFWVHLVVGDTEIELDRDFEAIEPARRTDELIASQKGLSLGEHRSQLALQQALLSPPGPDQQGTTGALHIQTSAANPAKQVERDVSLLAYWIENRRPDPSTSYHWYLKPFRWDGLPAAFGGHPRIQLDQTGDVYDLGAGPVATFPASHAGTFLVLCRAEQGGAPGGEARYLQSVLGAEETRTVAQLVEHSRRVDELGGRLEGESIPVVASHVAVQTGGETTLRLYLGRARGAPDTWRLLDLTPGLDPENHELEYDGASAADVLTDFEQGNRYPKGAISLRIDPNPLGAAPTTRRFQTDGQTLLGALSSRAGIASLLLTLGAVAAAPFTGGGSLLVTALILGATATAATAGALSLADHLRTEKLDQTAIALDVLTIATSFLNAAAAARALRGGPALLVASRGARFLLWTNVALEGVSAILVGVDGADQIARILESDAPPEQKNRLLVAVIANLILTGAMLVISYGDRSDTRGRLRRRIGETADTLADTDGRSLSLLDDDTLATLRGADARHLARLAAIVRDDPSAPGRLAGRSDLLPALRLAGGDTAIDLELAHAHLRLRRAGLEEPAIEHHLESIRKEARDGAQAAALAERILDDRARPKRPAGHHPLGLPADLADLRESLSPTARQAFDDKWQRIAKGSPTPTENQEGAFRAYLENLRSKNQGNLQTGLEEAAQRSAEPRPTPREPGDPPGSPGPTGPTAATDPRQWLDQELTRRAIHGPIFEGLDDQTTSKLRAALEGDPIAKSGRATQQAAETWALEGASGNPREFANRYEYARAKYATGHASALKELKSTPGARAKAAEIAGGQVSPEKLSADLARDNQTVRELGPGQHMGALPPDVSPDDVARRVQRLQRISYETETAESYHAIKHQAEIPSLENRTGDLVRDSAAAAMDTVQTGEIVLARRLEGGSIRIVIRKAYHDGRERLREAIVFVGPDGTVVLASYGMAKAKI